MSSWSPSLLSAGGASLSVREGAAGSLADEEHRWMGAPRRCAGGASLGEGAAAGLARAQNSSGGLLN